MGKEIDIKVKAKFVSKIGKGFPLIVKESIANHNDLQEEGSLVRLLDENNRFLAKGYYGKQNKGYGWVLTRRENEKIDQTFFNGKIRAAYEFRKSFLKIRRLQRSACLMGKVMELAV